MDRPDDNNYADQDESAEFYVNNGHEDNIMAPQLAQGQMLEPYANVNGAILETNDDYQYADPQAGILPQQQQQQHQQQQQQQYYDLANNRDINAASAVNETMDYQNGQPIAGPSGVHHSCQASYQVDANYDPSQIYQNGQQEAEIYDLDRPPLGSQVEMSHEVLTASIDSLREQASGPIYKEMGDIYDNFLHCSNARSQYENMLYEAQQRNLNDAHITKITGELTAANEKLDEVAQNLAQVRENFVASRVQLVATLSQLRLEVTQGQLARWRLEQQKSANGCLRDHETFVKLNDIQLWVERLLDSILRLRNQIKWLAGNVKVGLFQGQTNILTTIDELARQLDQNLQSLIEDSFVIEEQPPQLIKKGYNLKNNPVKLRLLAGRDCSIKVHCPMVSAVVLNEKDARDLAAMREKDFSPGEQHNFKQQLRQVCSKNFKQVKKKFSDLGRQRPRSRSDSKTKKTVDVCGFQTSVSGELAGETSELETNESNGQTECIFSTLTLKQVVHEFKAKGQETGFLDEKFIFCFYAQIRIDDMVQTNLMAFSLPFTSFTNPNQIDRSAASICWHNAFASQQVGEPLYHVPSEVSWLQLSEMLSDLFEYNTGRALDEENLRFLRDKLGLESDDDMVPYTKLVVKDNSGKKSFVFWDWFHKSFALVANPKFRLIGLYKSGYIAGFISKEETEKKLADKPKGTFLIRFSESMEGGITASWVSQAQDPEHIRLYNEVVEKVPINKVEISHLEPLDRKKLNTYLELERLFVDVIRDVKHLVYFYPDKPKREVITRECSKIDSRISNGYVKPLAIVTLPFDYPEDGIESMPSTVATTRSSSFSHNSPSTDATEYYDQNHDFN